MSPFVIPMIGVAVVYLAMIVLNERVGLFRCDVFPAPWMKGLAYAWLGLFMLFLAFLVIASSMRQPTAQQIAATPFYQFFALHAILVIFLGGWWLLTGRPPLRQFLNIRSERSGEAVLTGFAVGVGGWLVTIAVALLVAAILKATGLLPKDLKPSPMIGYLAAVPLWKKALIVLSAMTVEEAFFRGWLQKRIGLILSTILFASAHVTLGQPLLLIGVTVISLIIGATFYRTKNLLPGIIAHGVFDAVQLFVIIPIAFRFTEIGT
ncbi:MAG TPA: type II CAAX endopeptidase family protein [Thermoanaerobaculia bacterium]|jgi:membrane protease YdiL (CAAX protease family)|nr:type II CAAX endopeptidase family protein [Thermoanaerobaculia bacterium]